eukprot:3681065-Rhodomonas_salina.1
MEAETFHTGEIRGQRQRFLWRQNGLVSVGKYILPTCRSRTPAHTKIVHATRVHPTGDSDCYYQCEYLLCPGEHIRAKVVLGPHAILARVPGVLGVQLTCYNLAQGIFLASPYLTKPFPFSQCRVPGIPGSQYDSNKAKLYLDTTAIGFLGGPRNSDCSGQPRNFSAFLKTTRVLAWK